MTMARLSASADSSPVDAAIKIQASLIRNLPFATIISSMTLQFLKRHIAIQNTDGIRHIWQQDCYIAMSEEGHFL